MSSIFENRFLICRDLVRDAPFSISFGSFDIHREIERFQLEKSEHFSRHRNVKPKSNFTWTNKSALQKEFAETQNNYNLPLKGY